MSDTVWVLAAGANDMAIPLMVFLTEDDGVAYMTEHFPLVRSGHTEDHHWWTVADVINHSDRWEALVTDYYDGCGGIFEVTLSACPVGKPFINWSLD